jgi:protein-disulfide isomerase
MIRSIRILAAVVLGFVLAAPALAQTADDMSLGDPKAKVTVIEYASLSCTHCARFHNEVFPAFKRRYIDTGKVRFVYREFLTEPATLAAVGALTARCAGPKRYFDVIATIFAGQAEIYSTGNAREVLLRAGRAGGLDEARIDACLKDENAQAALNARVTRAIDVDKVQSTPTFVIGAKRLEGEQTLDTLAAAIDPLLAGRR